MEKSQAVQAPSSAPEASAPQVQPYDPNNSYSPKYGPGIVPQTPMMMPYYPVMVPQHNETIHDPYEQYGGPCPVYHENPYSQQPPMPMGCHVAPGNYTHNYPYQQYPCGQALHVPEVEYTDFPHGPGPSITTSPDRIRGPDGCNIFCFHLPNEMTNWDLYQLFKRFGNILSVHTMINPQTGLSRGFGFISYDSPDAADKAIPAMNGFRLGKKRLKVQRKRDDSYKPSEKEKEQELNATSYDGQEQDFMDAPTTPEVSDLESDRQPVSAETGIEGIDPVVQTLL